MKDLVTYTASALSAKDVEAFGIYDLYDANTVIGKTNKGIMTETYITIIKDGAGVGRVRILPANTAFIGTMGALTAINCDLNFIFEVLCCNDLSKKFSGSTIPHIYFKDYGEEEYSVPSYIEQNRIANLYIALDNLITLHQRKLDKLKNIKKSMLEKMFPKNGSNIPEIRFKGFTDAWEQRKLNNYLIVSDEKNSENLYKKEDVLSVSGDFGIVNQIEFQGRSFAGTSVLNYGVVHKGDVVYTKSPLKATPYGIIKTNKGSTGIVSVLYGVYHTKENANADFIQVYFEQNARLNNYLRPLVNKGAKNTLLISDEEALNGEVNFAPSLNEQLKISVVFNSIDNLITLHQRKIKRVLHKYTTINLFVR